MLAYRSREQRSLSYPIHSFLFIARKALIHHHNCDGFLLNLWKFQIVRGSFHWNESSTRGEAFLYYCQGESKLLKSDILEFVILLSLEIFAFLLSQLENKLKEIRYNRLLKEANNFTGHNQQVRINYFHRKFVTFGIFYSFDPWLMAEAWSHSFNIGHCCRNLDGVMNYASSSSSSGFRSHGLHGQCEQRYWHLTQGKKEKKVQ